MSRSDPHELVFCSFCGKAKHEVRSLIEGGCGNRALSQCVFICNECVALSERVIADTVGNAKKGAVVHPIDAEGEASLC